MEIAGGSPEAASVVSVVAKGPAAAGDPPRLRGLISSDVGDLDILQTKYRWIPNSSSIRPSPEVMEAKHKRLDTIISTFDSMRDYILSTVFMKSTKNEYMSGKLYAIDDAGVADMKVFAPNEFPYNLENGNHYIMWYGFTPSDIIDKDPLDFSDDINAEIKRMLGEGVDYEYAYYVNPKMTVPDFFHLQVFWIKK